MRGRRQSQSEMKFWCKIFQTKHDLVGAICDQNLLEKELRDRNFKIKITKHFYGGKLIDGELAVKVMDRVTIGNIIGKNIVEIATNNGFIIKENTILIDGVPHAQFAKL